MKTVFYEGPHEGIYDHVKFFNALSRVPVLKLNGRYRIQSKDGREGEIGLGWQMGSKLSGARLIYTVRFTNRPRGLKSLFMGPVVYGDVKVELKSLKEERIDGIEGIIKKALSSE